MPEICCRIHIFSLVFGSIGLCTSWHLWTKGPWRLQSWELITQMSSRPHELWRMDLLQLLGCLSCYKSLFFKKRWILGFEGWREAKGWGRCGGRKCHSQKMWSLVRPGTFPMLAQVWSRMGPRGSWVPLWAMNSAWWRPRTLMHLWLLNFKKGDGAERGPSASVRDGERFPHKQPTLGEGLPSSFWQRAVCPQFLAPAHWLPCDSGQVIEPSCSLTYEMGINSLTTWKLFRTEDGVLGVNFGAVVIV